MPRDERPYPIRTLPDGQGWEVKIVEGDVGDIRCDSRQDAESVADGRALVQMAKNGEVCNPARVRRCIDALARAGRNVMHPHVRRLLDLENRSSRSFSGA